MDFGPYFVEVGSGAVTVFMNASSVRAEEALASAGSFGDREGKHWSRAGEWAGVLHRLRSPVALPLTCHLPALVQGVVVAECLLWGHEDTVKQGPASWWRQSQRVVFILYLRTGDRPAAAKAGSWGLSPVSQEGARGPTLDQHVPWQEAEA